MKKKVKKDVRFKELQFVPSASNLNIVTALVHKADI